MKFTKLEKRWILYDVGNSAFVLLCSTIIPIYYKNVAQASGISAADSTAYFSYATSLVTLLVAVLGPVLGSLADTKGFKKPVFTFFMMMGVLGCAGLAVPKTWIAFLDFPCFFYDPANVGNLTSGSSAFPKPNLCI